MLALLCRIQEVALTSVPAPSGVASWWPFIVAGVSALFAAWVKISEKKVDAKTSLDAAEAKAKVDRLRAEFDDQEKFRNTLMAAFEKALEENEKLRASIVERDKVISDLLGTVESMRKRINSLEASVCVVSTGGEAKLKKIDPTETLRARVEQRGQE